MEEEIKIQAARPYYQEAGALNYIAIGNLCHVMVGTNHEKTITHYMQRLYNMKGNRFSHEHTLAATINGEVAGLITCMPYQHLEQTLLPTIFQIASLKKLKVIPQLMNYHKSIVSLIQLSEGEQDEYHVSMLSVDSKFQRRGVGKVLLEAAENIAKQKGYHKISLTVNQYNEKANALYQKLGYEKVGSTDVVRVNLNKMRKILMT